MKMNNKGMTLVEMVIAIVLLAIAGILFTSAFSATASILNRATYYKNYSSAAASTVEMQAVQTSPVSDIKVKTDNTNNASVEVSGTKNSQEFSFTSNGQYFRAKDDTGNVALVYREFLPNDMGATVINATLIRDEDYD